MHVHPRHLPRGKSRQPKAMMSRPQSPSLTLRTAHVITGAVTAANPEGSPGLRSVILVIPLPRPPRVGHLHRERILSGGHRKSATGFDLTDLVGALQRPA